MTRPVVRSVLVLFALVVLLAPVAPARAEAQESAPTADDAVGATGQQAPTSDQGATTGPGLSLDKMTVDPGEQVTIAFVGWAGRVVTLSVCGNLAKRGSADCNMVASQGVRLYHVDVTPVTSFLVSAPPGTCPCVIRASSDTGEVATAPIEIRGVEVGPVLDPFGDEPPFEVAVSADAVPDSVLGVLRSWVGGATPYRVTVKVHNQTTEAYSKVALHGMVGHDESVVAGEFDMQPGVIGPGQTWTGTADVTLPSLTAGTYSWVVTASGAGPVSTGRTETRSVPWLLCVLIALLVGIVVRVVVRLVQVRRDRRRGEGERGSGEPTGGPESLPPPPSPPTPEEPQLVGV